MVGQYLPQTNEKCYSDRCDFFSHLFPNDQLCGGIRSDHLDLADERRFCKVCGVLLASVWTPMKLLHYTEKFRLRFAAPSELRKFRPDKFSCHGNHGPSYGYSRPIERPVAVPAKLFSP